MHAACPDHFRLSWLIALRIFGEECKLGNSWLCNSIHVMLFPSAVINVSFKHLRRASLLPSFNIRTDRQTDGEISYTEYREAQTCVFLCTLTRASISQLPLCVLTALTSQHEWRQLSSPFPNSHIHITKFTQNLSLYTEPVLRIATVT
jgi:hypothetical protein